MRIIVRIRCCNSRLFPVEKRFVREKKIKDGKDKMISGLFLIREKEIVLRVRRL